MAKELIDGIQGIGLDSVVCRVHYELRYLGLWKEIHVSEYYKGGLTRWGRRPNIFANGWHTECHHS
jgi:hypothetical protein